MLCFALSFFAWNVIKHLCSYCIIPKGSAMLALQNYKVTCFNFSCIALSNSAGEEVTATYVFQRSTPNSPQSLFKWELRSTRAASDVYDLFCLAMKIEWLPYNNQITIQGVKRPAWQNWTNRGNTTTAYVRTVSKCDIATIFFIQRCDTSAELGNIFHYHIKSRDV